MASVRFLLTEIHVDKSKLSKLLGVALLPSLLPFLPPGSCLKFLSGLPLLMCKSKNPFPSVLLLIMVFLTVIGSKQRARVSLGNPTYLEVVVNPEEANSCRLPAVQSLPPGQ